MTRSRLILSIFRAVLIFFFALLLILIPYEGIHAVLFLIGFGLTLRGFQTLLYYFFMARYMVGGKQVLYRTILLLDLGIFTSSVSAHPSAYIILYLAGIHIFNGAVLLLRANETRNTGSPKWGASAVYGLLHLGMSAAIIVFGLLWHSTVLAVYLYALGLFNTAITLIVHAFKPTAIVYIQ